MPLLCAPRMPVSVGEAVLITKRVCRRILKHRAENIPLEKALGRLVARDVFARVDVPPFDNSSMDGFALRAADIYSVPSRLKIVGTIPAGIFPDIKIKKGECAKIMTGSVMPAGADTVVMKEFCRTEAAGREVIILEKPRRGDNVRRRGEDILKGKILVKKGTTLQPAMLGILASQGFGSIEVRRRSVVGFITTGDEVVMPRMGPKKAPPRGKIYNVNRYTMEAAILDCGCEPFYFGHCSDSVDSVKHIVGKNLSRVDVLITIGGVSMGEYDVVKDALKSLGARFYFEKIKMKPGRPTGFAVLKGKPVFTLPGNVVSSLIAFEMLVIPAILPDGDSSSVFTIKNARAGFSFSKNDERRHILRVRIFKDSHGDFWVRPSGGQGSGILSTMASANGYVVIPEGKQSILRGAALEVAIPRSFLHFSLADEDSSVFCRS